MLLPVVCCVVVAALVCSFGTLECWGGATGRKDVALSYVYANSGCVAATLAVCLVSLFVSVCCCLVRVVIIYPASTHTLPRWCPVRA